VTLQVYDTCLSRAGAELMAAATCLGSGSLALNQVKAIAEQLLAEAGKSDLQVTCVVYMCCRHSCRQDTVSYTTFLVVCLVKSMLERKHGHRPAQPGVAHVLMHLIVRCCLLCVLQVQPHPVTVPMAASPAVLS
jgi:hypothetical protein